MNSFSTLQNLIQNPSIEVNTMLFVIALVASAGSGLVVSILYRLFYENRATGSQIHRSFLLIGPATTALFIAIQFSLPLSLGLVGALSIIRFRTPIKEPEEVGFLMVVIATSIVSATFRFVLLGILLALIIVILLLQQFAPRLFRGVKRTDGVLLVTLGRDSTEQSQMGVVNTLSSLFPAGRIQSISHTEDMATIHFSFAGAKPESLVGLKSALDEIAPVEKMSVFYNRAGLV